MLAENVNVFEGPEAVAQAAADFIEQKINDVLEDKALCHIVLPGGSTPARCLQLLAEKSLPWESIHWYPGDERCYPVGHAERNDTMIREKLFLQQSNAENNFHPIAAELGPDKGAHEYAAILDAVGIMDIVVLGMGEDGHTASLFPGNAALTDMHSAVPVYDAPKPPAQRVSTGLNTLKNAVMSIVITTGESKRPALTKIFQGETLPVAMVDVDLWFIDQDATPE